MHKRDITPLSSSLHQVSKLEHELGDAVPASHRGVAKGDAKIQPAAGVFRENFTSATLGSGLDVGGQQCYHDFIKANRQLDAGSPVPTYEEIKSEVLIASTYKATVRPSDFRGESGAIPVVDESDDSCDDIDESDDSSGSEDEEREARGHRSSTELRDLKRELRRRNLSCVGTARQLRIRLRDAASRGELAEIVDGASGNAPLPPLTEKDTRRLRNRERLASAVMTCADSAEKRSDRGGFVKECRLFAATLNPHIEKEYRERTGGHCRFNQRDVLSVAGDTGPTNIQTEPNGDQRAIAGRQFTDTDDGSVWEVFSVEYASELGAIIAHIYSPAGEKPQSAVQCPTFSTADELMDGAEYKWSDGRPGRASMSAAAEVPLRAPVDDPALVGPVAARVPAPARHGSADDPCFLGIGFGDADGTPILKRAAKISGGANMCWARVLMGRPDGTRSELSDFVSSLGDQFGNCDDERSAARLASDAQDRNRYAVREVAKWAARFKVNARWLKENGTYNWPLDEYPPAAPVFLLYALVAKCAILILERRTSGDGYYATLHGGAFVKPKRLTVSQVSAFLSTRRANDRCVLLGFGSAHTRMQFDCELEAT